MGAFAHCSRLNSRANIVTITSIRPALKVRGTPAIGIRITGACLPNVTGFSLGIPIRASASLTILRNESASSGWSLNDSISCSKDLEFSSPVDFASCSDASLIALKNLILQRVPIKGGVQLGQAFVRHLGPPEVDTRGRQIANRFHVFIMDITFREVKLRQCGLSSGIRFPRSNEMRDR